jgi:hypothetical protein
MNTAAKNASEVLLVQAEPQGQQAARGEEQRNHHGDR